MTEEEIIKKYKEEQEKKQLIAKHSYLSENADTSHQDYLHSTHETPRSTEVQQVDPILYGTTNLEKARWEQAQRGETSLVGATGDSMLVDSEGNFIKTTSPFDRANTSAQYEYATPQETAKYITENKVPVGNTVVDYTYAKKVLDSDLAWSDYLETGTLASKKKAQELDADLKAYEEKVGYMVGNMPYVSANAQQVPQQLYYLQENALAAVPAAVVGGVVKATSKSNKAATIAAKITYDIASKATSFDATKKMTQGSLYRELVNMGIPEDTAKYYAQDSAVQQAWVETGSGVIQDFVEWIIGYTVGGTIPGKIAKSVLGSKFADVLIESTEELIQEEQSINAEKNALKASGLDSSMYTPEYEAQRRGEAFASAIPVTLGVAGLGGTASQVATTVIVDQKNIQSIKNSYKQSINNLEQQNADLQAKIDAGNLSGKEKYTANKQINDNNKQIKVLQDASSDENVKNDYEEYKKFQKALQESPELRDSTKFVETNYRDNATKAISNAQSKAREIFENDNIHIEAETNITQVEKNLKDVIEKRTGKDVVFYTTFGIDDLGNIRGFVDNADKGTIYIEAGQNAKDTMASAIHEYGHILAGENETLFNAFEAMVKDKFGKELDNKLLEVNKQTGSFNLKDGEKLTDFQKKYIMEEMFGDQLAEIATRDKNVKALENSTLSVFDKIKDAVKSYASEAVGIDTTNQRISGYDFSGASYANGDILQNNEFEKMVMDTLKSIGEKKKEEKKEEAPKARKIVRETVDDRIARKYKDMKSTATKEEIKNMIAKELGLKYEGKKDDLTADGKEVNKIYKNLVDYGKVVRESGFKWSKEAGKEATPQDYSSKQVASNGEPITNGVARWAEKSKARDTDNLLFMYYHGSPFGKLDQFNPRYRHNGASLGDGFYLTQNYERALDYTDERYSDKVNAEDYVTPAILNIKNPLDITEPEECKQQILEKFDSMIKRFNPDMEGADYTEDTKDMLIDKTDGPDGSWFYDFITFVTDGVAHREFKNEYGGTEHEYTDTRDIFRYLGFDGIMDYSDAVIFNSNQAKDPNNPDPTEDSRFKFSARKNDDKLKAKNKELKEDNEELIKQLKKDNTAFQRAVKHKGEKVEDLVIKGIKQEEKTMKATEKAIEEHKKVKIRKYDAEFDRRKAKSDLPLDMDDRARYEMLRFDGIKADEAFRQVEEMRTSLSEVEIKTKQALEYINQWFKNYKKLSPEIQAQVDGYKKYYRKGVAITPAQLMNIRTTAEYLKLHASELEKDKILSKKVREQMESEEPIALKDVIKTKEDAEKFINGVNKIQWQIMEQQETDRKLEALKTFEKDAGKAENDIREAVKNVKVKNKLATTKDKAVKQLMTFKTQTEALFDGKKDSGAMYLNNNLQKAERRKRRFITDVYKKLDPFMEKSSGFNGLIERRKWKKNIEKDFSHEAEFKKKFDDIPAMPTSMIASLRAARKDTQFMSHITGAVTSAKVIAGDGFLMPKLEFKEGGGVLIPNEKLYRRGDISEAYAKGKVYKLTLEQVDKLIGTLTDEQKAFADTIHDIYEFIGDSINEVSDRVYGYDIANVKDYFPIRVASEESMWGKNVIDVASMLSTYRNALGSGVLFGNPQLQARNENAFSPILLENIVDTLSRTVNNISTFYGYAEALWKNELFLNTRFGDGGIDVGDGAKKISMKGALDYLDRDYLKDYNRMVNYIVGTEKHDDGWFRRMMGARTLTFNVGTWLTQPASFVSTYKYYNPKDFWTALIKSHDIGADSVNKMIRGYYEDQGVDTSKIKNFELMRMFVAEATPILDARALNFRTPLISSIATDTKWSKFLNSTKMLQLFDDIAVSTIARMQIYNTALQATFGTEEYFEKLADNLETIMEETQPTSAEINKANAFRNKNEIVRGLTMFGVPANQLINNAAQTTLELHNAMKNGTDTQKKQAWGNFAKMAGSLIAGQAYVAAIRAMRESIRAKDDDDTPWGERWVANFIIALLSPTLIGDEIASFIMSKTDFGAKEFYDFETPGTALANDIATLGEKIWNLFNSDISPTKRMVDTIKTLGTVAPIDTRSLIHIAEAIMKFTMSDVYKAYSLSTNQDAYEAWAKTSNTPMAEFYKAYTATRPKELEKLGYHKADKDNNIKSNLEETRRKALEGVFSNKATVDKYMEILFNYKP